MARIKARHPSSHTDLDEQAEASALAGINPLPPPSTACANASPPFPVTPETAAQPGEHADVLTSEPTGGPRFELPEATIHAIRRMGSNHADVDAALHFGSRAQGRQQAASNTAPAMTSGSARRSRVASRSGRGASSGATLERIQSGTVPPTAEFNR